jgi:hypothetical protein
MCNLYSITTNQAAIVALFRVLNRYVGNLPPMPGNVSRLSSPRGAQQRRRRTRADHDDALGNAASAAASEVRSADDLAQGEVQGSIPCASTSFKGFLSRSRFFPQ